MKTCDTICQVRQDRHVSQPWYGSLTINVLCLTVTEIGGLLLTASTTNRMGKKPISLILLALKLNQEDDPGEKVKVTHNEPSPSTQGPEEDWLSHLYWPLYWQLITKN